MTPILFLFSCVTAIAQPAAPVTQAVLLKKLELLQPVRDASRGERVLGASSAFLGSPYIGGGSTGEGRGARFDQDPVITFQGFDCTTYVEAAIALAETAQVCSASQDAILPIFLNQSIAIKYRNGSDVSYVNRNHFTEVDWLPALQRLGILADATELFSEFDATELEIFIERHTWGMAKGKDDLRIYESRQISEKEKDARLGDLHFDFDSESKAAIPSLLRVITLETLASTEFEKSLTSVLQIQKILQFQLVKKTSPAFGMRVTHQGFIVLGQDGKPAIRHASPSAKAVVDFPFRDYVEARKTDKLPTLGFNIQRFLN